MHIAHMCRCTTCAGLNCRTFIRPLPNPACTGEDAFCSPLHMPPAPCRVTELLERRRQQQAQYDAGEKPHFLPETKKVRVYVCVCVCGGCDGGEWGVWGGGGVGWGSGDVRVCRGGGAGVQVVWGWVGVVSVCSKKKRKKGGRAGPGCLQGLLS